MVNSTREIDNILDIEPVSNPSGNALVKQANQALGMVKENYQNSLSSDPRFNDDFEEIRENLKEIILEVNDNVKKLSMIAQENEKASSFSALAQLVTTLMNANKQLLEIYSEKKKYEDKFRAKDVPTDGAGTINVQNAIFTGTTRDLDEYILEVQRRKEQSD